MIGILTEKASAARNFAKALGGMKGNFNGEDYVIVSASGHLYAYPKDVSKMISGETLQAKYKEWDVSNLPWSHQEISWKRQPRKDATMTISNIKNTLTACSEIAIATDVDPTGEGDLIAVAILEELGLDRKPISRFYFIDESVKEIQKAFVSRKSIPNVSTHPDYLKAAHRSKFDYMTMQFTRIALTASDGRSVLRQGRLKSAMVVIVGDGLKAVAGYKKIPFYQNRFRDENGNVYTNPNESRYDSETQVPQSYKPSAVVRDSVERKKTPPRKLIDLSTLASILAPKGYNAKLVMDVYQKMYENQVVSYPRTEDKYVSPEQFKELLPLADKIADVVNVDKSLLTHRTPRGTHVKTGGAHGANRPGLNVPSSLSSLEADYGEAAPIIYTLLAKSYLAILAEDYEYDFERGHVADYPDFKATTGIPVKLGWKQVFGAQESGDDEEECGKHIGTTASPFVFEGFPPRPKTPTMKWLMEQLAKHDIGTGATRTSTYAEVTKIPKDSKSSPNLLVDKKGKITLSDAGAMSYQVLPGTKIGSLELTKEVQEDMKAIAAGQANAEQLLPKIADYVKHDLQVMMDNGKDIENARPVPKEKHSGVWAKTGQEVSFNREWSGYRFSDEECAKLLAGETIAIAAVSAKTGKTFNCKGFLDEGEFNGKKFVGFQPIRDIPDAFCGHTFTEIEIANLRAGKSVSCSDFISQKTGNTYTALVKWNANESKMVMTFDIPATFNGHTFIAAEITDLRAGKTISCKNLVSKKGSKYEALVKWDAKNSKMVMTFDIPATFNGHTFTAQEIADLRAGKAVIASDLISGKTGKVYTAELKWDKKANKIEMNFGNRRK
jgi:DNA topoisomerase-3